MSREDRAEEREERIRREVFVDAYTQDEQAMGWSVYLNDTLEFPFEARCVEERDISPLKEGETVLVIGMPSIAPSLHTQFVMVAWNDRELGVALSQLQSVDAGSDTKEAIADWQYWLDR